MGFGPVTGGVAATSVAPVVGFGWVAKLFLEFGNAVFSGDGSVTVGKGRFDAFGVAVTGAALRVWDGWGGGVGGIALLKKQRGDVVGKRRW